MSAGTKKIDAATVLTKALSLVDAFAKDNSKEAVEARLKKAKEDERKAEVELAQKQQVLGYIKVAAGVTSGIFVLLALRALARARELS